MSYLSQMLALASHNFLSAAVGISIAAAVVRGIVRHSAQTIGNFWVDLVRINYYLLIPICVIYALFLVAQGIPQNFKPYDTAKVVEVQTVQVPKKDDKGNPVNDAKGNPVMVDQKVDSQSIVQGPIASQMAIKMLGTNGGGYMNANAAHPFENPTPLSNFFQMLSIFAIPSALTYYLGLDRPIWHDHSGHGARRVSWAKETRRDRGRHISCVGDAIRDFVDWNNTACRRAYLPSCRR